MKKGDLVVDFMGVDVLGYLLILKYFAMMFMDRDKVIGYNAWYMRYLFKEYGVSSTIVYVAFVAPLVEEMVFRHLAYTVFGLATGYWVVQVVWVVMHWGNKGFMESGCISRSILMAVDALILTWFEVHMFPMNIVYHMLSNINSIITSSWIAERCIPNDY